MAAPPWPKAAGENDRASRVTKKVLRLRTFVLLILVLLNMFLLDMALRIIESPLTPPTRKRR